MYCRNNWKERRTFSDKFELDGIIFEEPSINLFSFNNPYGACRRCEGFGKVLGIDEDLVIPDKSLSVYEGAIAPWRSEKMNEWQVPLVKHGSVLIFLFTAHTKICLKKKSNYCGLAMNFLTVWMPFLNT
jgi:excinuclease UvrABC ATPase subunit